MPINDDIRAAVLNATKLEAVTVNWDSTEQLPPNQKVTRNLLDTINNIPDKVLDNSTVIITANTSGVLVLSLTVGE